MELSGKLIAIGGNDGNSSHNSVETYDPETNRWSPLASMSSRRSSVGAAVVNCFNMELKQNWFDLKPKHEIAPWLSRGSKDRNRTTSLN